MTAAAGEPAAITRYLGQLSRALRPLGHDREQILAELRSHLLLRAQSIGADAAIAELGPPDRCAQGFIDELRLQTAFADGSPRASLLALSTVAARSLLGSLALLFAGVFYLLAFAFVVLLPLKLVFPDAVGLWMSQEPDGVVFRYGLILGEARTGQEVLGYYSLATSALGALASYFLASWVARSALWLLLRRTRAGLVPARA